MGTPVIHQLMPPLSVLSYFDEETKNAIIYYKDFQFFLISTYFQNLNYHNFPLSVLSYFDDKEIER